MTGLSQYVLGICICLSDDRVINSHVNNVYIVTSVTWFVLCYRCTVIITKIDIIESNVL